MLTEPQPGSRRRGMLVAAASVVATMVIVLGARYATFDPQRFASEVDDELSALAPGTVQTLHGIAAASTASSVSAALEAVPADTAARVDRYGRTMVAMRQRFHAGEGPCARYPTASDVAVEPRQLDEVAEAILAADLAARIEPLVRESFRWTREEDAAAHKADQGAEILAYFTDAASAWNKLGIAMHRAAVERAILDGVGARALRGDPARDDLRPDEEARGRELWKRYDGLLLRGGMRIAARRGSVDLRAPQLCLLEPGMSRATVRARLGTPEEDGALWRYRRYDADVSFDAQDRVTGIAVTVGRLHAPVVADGKPVLHRDEAAIASLLGAPLRSAEGEAGEAVLVYDAGSHVRLLVFAEQLTRVELWRRDLVTKPAP